MSNRPGVEPVVGAANAAAVLPPPRDDVRYYPFTFSGQDLRLRTMGGLNTDGSGSLFANVCASLAGFNFHYCMFNGEILAEKSMWTTRTTSDAHRNKGEGLVKAVSDWLQLDWAGFPMFAVDPESGKLRMRFGLSRNMIFFGDGKHVPIGFQNFQGSVSANPE